ncbi:MAG: polysaccharide biosynthesis tyrosine autokinase [Elusimicrobia bacterium]|nr:polysaccharide biosynthesis tyrosine autokinase [Elusimicrobiota bacterium]
MPAEAPVQDAAPDVDLAQLLQVFQRRRWIVLSVFLVALLSAALHTFTARPIYTASALLLIEKELGHAYNETAKIENAADDYYQTQYKLLKSRTLLKKVHQTLELDKTEDFGGGVDALAGAVAVAPVLRSRLVNVLVDSHSPELAARVANRLAETYASDNLQNKLFISREILQALHPEQGGGLHRESVNALPPVVNNPLIQNLKASYANLESRFGELSRRYTPEHPVRARLKAEMDAIGARIEQETDRIVQGMKVELSGQLLGNNVRVVDPAEVPLRPSKPRKGRTLAVAALLGLLLGYLLALGIDSLDQTIYTQEDVERKLSLPFLGSVTKADLGTSESAAEYQESLTRPDSFTGEALKNIRTMLGFAAAGKEMKRLLITSTSQGEGKTFIAINLALVFAQLGERVLLIEGDLRRPNLHKRFRLSNEAGLGHFLAHGQDVSEAATLIQETVLPNLQVLVCGPIPPNPAELLSTPRVKALLDWAAARYDHVIVDGTPVFPITDALLWGNHADAAVFVVKFGGVHSGLALRARQKLQDGGLKISGAIVNQVTWKAGGYYGDYYYAYHYRYGTAGAADQAPKGSANGAAERARSAGDAARP